VIVGSDLGLDLHSSPLANGTIFLGDELKVMLPSGSYFRKGTRAWLNREGLGKTGVVVGQRKGDKVSGRGCVSRDEASGVGLVKAGS
jgi:hypothetical protein